ncbi:MAG TPA: GntR family transcriptional regulator [Bryobacteraceae bacterium]|nr:GntR family transcriptional regulator [Bryobacteraceae bacterium]
MSDPAEYQSLASEAYSIVRLRILRGDLTMGQVISRRKLATELGMSFLPVSEALLKLEFEGLLESRPRAGTRVRIPTVQDVQGHFVVREALESQAARLFTVAATAEEKAELARLALRVDTLSMQPDADRYQFLSLHEKLHRRIAECARCESLSEAIEKTHALASTWMCVGRQSEPGDPPRRTHQDLIAILSGRDPEAAAGAMRRHILASKDKSVERLKPYFQLHITRGTTFVRSTRKPRTAANAGSTHRVPAVQST